MPRVASTNGRRTDDETNIFWDRELRLCCEFDPDAGAGKTSRNDRLANDGEPAAGDVDRLPGRWVRVEGGYVISIKAVGADGRLDAEYANPRTLPFYTAVATSEGGVLKLFLELRAGGYGGSTYTLIYDAASDRLLGEYNQVVVNQKFSVVFVRAK